MPDGGASLFATLASAFTATGTTAAATTATAAAALGGTTLTAGAGGVGTAAAAGGLTLAEAATIASGVSGLAGTGAQLLAEKPTIKSPSIASRDDAQREADLRSELYRKRGRAAALLTPGGAKGDTSQASLGAAALLGS